MPFVVVAVLLSTSSSGVGAASTAPLKLSAGVLDSIGAGYLRVSSHAFAEALGDSTIAIVDVATDVRPHRSTRRHHYTIGRAGAHALAAGSVAVTDVGAVYETDEEVVRVRLREHDRSRGSARGIAGRLGVDLPDDYRLSSLSYSRVVLTVVTRTSRQ